MFNRLQFFFDILKSVNTRFTLQGNIATWVYVILLALTLNVCIIYSAQAATITVDTTGDVAANDGVCSLREAITAANSNSASGAASGECLAGSGADTINFAIGGTGEQTITLSSALPTLSGNITIDGSSQPGFVDTPLIRINASTLSATPLNVSGNASTLKDLALVGDNMTALTLSSAMTVTLENLDLSNISACAFYGSGTGIYAGSSSHLTIHNVSVKNRGVGMSFRDGSDIELMNNDFSGSGCANAAFALQLINISKDGTTGRGVLAASNVYSGANQGIYLENLSNLTVSNLQPVTSTNYLVLEDSSGIGEVAGTSLWLSSVSTATIESVNLSKSATCAFYGSGTGIYAGAISHLTIHNVSVKNRGSGMYFRDGSDIELMNNDFSGSGCANAAFALVLSNISKDGVTGRGVLVASNVYTGANQGILLENLSNLTVSNLQPVTSTNYLVLEDSSGIGGVAGTSLWLSSVSTATIESVNLSNSSACAFYGSGTGIYAGAISHLTIHNVSVKNRGSGMYFRDGSDIELVNNDFSGSGCANAAFALVLSNISKDGVTGRGVLAASNVYTGANQGILLENLSNLAVSNLQPVTSTNYLVLEDSSGIGELVGTSLWLSSVSTATIESVNLSKSATCAFYGSGTGIYAGAISHLTIHNVSVKNRGSGMYFRDGSDIELMNNDFSGSGCANSAFALQLINISKDGTTGRGVLVASNVYTGANQGIYLENLSNLTVSNLQPVTSTNYLVLEDSSGIGSVSSTSLWLSSMLTTTVDSINLSSPKVARGGNGLYVTGGNNLTVQSIRVKHRSNGVVLLNTTNSTLSCSSLIDNDVALNISQLATIVNNRFHDNSNAIAMSGTGPLIAENNYWGAANGPIALGGSGNSYSGSVDAQPFLTSKPPCAAQFLYDVITATSGGGSGSISLNPAGGTYDYATVVTATAVADSSSTFSNWSGNCSGSSACVLTVKATKSITAAFALAPPAGLQLFNSSPTGLGNQTLFTATLTTGGNVTYTWNFGDSSPQESGLSAATSHTYTTAGRFVASVRAVNAQGNISKTTPVTITLATLAPNTFADELNSDGDCSLREAIQAANTDHAVDLCPAGNGADTIQVAAGTYTLTLSGANEDANATGDLDATSADGLTLIGAGANSTSINANSLDRAIHATAGVLTLNNLTIQNGNSSGKGGGVYASNNLTLTNTRFISNSATGCCGGGAYSDGGATVANSLFSSNNSAGGGGGFYSNSTLDVTDSQFLSNTTTTQGGGAYARNTATVVNSLFQNNRSTTYYGGGFHAAGNLTLINSQLINNRAGADGGGVMAEGLTTVYDSLFQSNVSQSAQGGGMNVSESAIISNSQFLSNTAAIGGGAFVYRAATLVGDLFQNNTSTYYGGGGLAVNNTLTLSDTQFISNTARGPNGGGALYVVGSNNSRIVNSLFARNSTESNGAALYLGTAGQVTLLHSTLASPSVANGAAIYVAAGTVGITNTILANHSVGIQAAAGSVSEDYNLFSGNTVALSGSISSGGNSLNGDPAFQSMCAGNYHLAPGSAAFNAAVDAGVPSDFEGDARPLLGGYDIGADELDSLSLSDVAICGVSAVNSSAQPVNSSVSFTASLSGGTNVSYTWNFGDGTILNAPATTSHSYSGVGSYTAIVTASNSINTLSATTLVTVTPGGDVVQALTVGNSATLVYHAPDGATITVEVPSTAITQSLYLVYNTEITPTTTPGNLIFGNRAFHLEAWLGNQILSGINFNPPLTLTLDYLASDASGLNEDLLEIYYFDTTTNQWSNAGMTVVERDTVNHRLVVQLSHLTEFALLQTTLPPVVMDDADLTLINTPLDVHAPGVLANDSDPEGATLSAQLVTPPSHGSVTLASNGGFVYTPTTDYSGMDSFQYTTSDGQYMVTGTVTINVFQTGSNPGPIVLPEAGWNLFGYPLANSHLVTEVLASISGTYTSVFGYDASDPNDPWRMYDPSIPAPFNTILNRLTRFEYGQGYWIDLAQPVTITLPNSVMAVTGAGLDAMAMTPQPPATFYGELSSKDSFVPRAGMAVEAWIGDTLCGQSITQATSEGRVIYALHVQAAGSGNLQNCGAAGRNVTLHVDGLPLTTLPWSNESLQQVTATRPEETPTANKHVFLPIVANR